MFARRRADTLRALSAVLDIFTVFGSVACLVALVLCIGFDRSVVGYARVAPWLRSCQMLFCANILFNLLLKPRTALHTTRPLKWVVDIAVLITLVPALWPHQLHPIWPWLDGLLHSHVLLAISLGLYSIVYLCYAMVRSMGRHTNPSLILSASFLLLIAVGTLLLLLPNCTHNGIGLVDALFVSTSAVCICGLTPVDISTVFTPLGVVVIGVMMQVGALGVMTFTSSFALFFSGNAPIYSQMMMKDMFYSRTINSLLPTLLYALMFTLTVEAVGAVAIYFSVAGTLPGYDTAQEVGFAVFHAVSAFCNAGFSTIADGFSNPVFLYGNQLVYLVISLLVMAGGIGFPILANTKDAAVERMRRVIAKMLHRPLPSRQPNLYSMNTKVALTTTFVLFVLTFIIFTVAEWNYALQGLSPYAKIVQGVFNSVTPRSAGFVSINPSGFMPPVMLWIMLMMWIGASSQSTAGGIKVNTFAAALLHLRATITGHSRVTVFHRTITSASLARAQAVVSLSIISYVTVAGILLWLAPELPVKAVLFEALSALFTVGSSLGITDILPDSGKGLLCVAMFVGRVGLLNLLMGWVGEQRENLVNMPEDNLIIN